LKERETQEDRMQKKCVYVGDIHTHIHTQTDDREQREERDMKEK
jgi:hypothetical protein